MSQAINIDAVSTSGFTDVVMKSPTMVDALKKEQEEIGNPFASKSRRGKKTELMPTNGKIVELQEFASQKSEAPAAAQNSQQPGYDPVNGTSIYFRLAALYVNNLMQNNQLEMSAQAIALQANQKAMELVQQGYNQLNEDVSMKETYNQAKTEGFVLGTFLGGLAATVVGIVLICTGVGVGIGVPLLIGGVAMMAAGPALGSVNAKNPGNMAFISSLLDDSPNEPAILAKNQALSSQLGSLSSTANNDTSRNTQALQNINSLQQQFANMFSQMMNYYSSSMSAR